ncbi:MAG: bacillithiol system redox-active protein YtxJ [candidate division Zixibacteria bacterium]
MINNYKSIDDYEKILAASQTQPVFLLKHSTACGVSRVALAEFEKSIETEPEVQFWIVLVREDRPLSLDIAERTKITHQSPQLIMFSMGQPVWNCSHFDITAENLKNNLRQPG